MKILNIHDYPPIEGGGIEINVSRVSALLVKEGNQVAIATSRFRSETYIERKSEVFDFNGVTLYLLKNLKHLISLLKTYEITHTHFTFSCRPAAIYAVEYGLKLGKPIVVSIHTLPDHIPFSALSQRLPLESDYILRQVKRLFGHSKVSLVAPSQKAAEELKKFGIEKRIHIVPNAVVVEKPGSTSRDNLRELSITPVDITYVGEISLLKGVNYLIDAIKIVSSDFNFPIRARLIGGGSDFNLIRSQVEYFKLKDVVLTGYIKNALLPSYLKATKLLVHPSLTETWGIAVAEALFFGVPVIATEVGGLIDLTQKGNFALLVPPADSMRLAKVIYSIIKSKAKYRELKARAQKGSEFIKTHYTLERQAKALMKLYHQLLERQ